MALRNRDAYNRSRGRTDFVPPWLRKLEAESRAAAAEAAREHRAKHPRKKQPRLVREEQPMKSLNPHGRGK
jgi:hypothetical protein